MKVLNESVKKYFITGLLLALLGWSLATQTFFLSAFDRAKQAVARWPYFSSPHLRLAVALFNTSSKNSQTELIKGKQGLFLKEKLIKQTENIVSQPKVIEQEIDFWQAFSEKGIQLPQAYLNLALLNFKIYKSEETKKYWQKAFYLDPNNKTIEELGKIINN